MEMVENLTLHSVQYQERVTSCRSQLQMGRVTLLGIMEIYHVGTVILLAFAQVIWVLSWGTCHQPVNQLRILIFLWLVRLPGDCVKQAPGWCSTTRVVIYESVATGFRAPAKDTGKGCAVHIWVPDVHRQTHP